MSESKEIAPIKQEHCEHNLSVNIRLWHKCFMDLKKLFIIHMFMRRLDVSAIKTTGAFDTRTAFIYIHLFRYIVLHICYVPYFNWWCGESLSFPFCGFKHFWKKCWKIISCNFLSVHVDLGWYFWPRQKTVWHLVVKMFCRNIWKCVSSCCVFFLLGKFWYRVSTLDCSPCSHILTT